MLNPRFLCQLCIDKSISERIKQRQHIVLVLDLTSLFKTTKINKEPSRNYCKARNKSFGVKINFSEFSVVAQKDICIIYYMA